MASDRSMLKGIRDTIVSFENHRRA